jgi:hypothetical protein
MVIRSTGLPATTIGLAWQVDGDTETLVEPASNPAAQPVAAVDMMLVCCRAAASRRLPVLHSAGRNMLHPDWECIVATSGQSSILPCLARVHCKWDASGALAGPLRLRRVPGERYLQSERVHTRCMHPIGCQPSSKMHCGHMWSCNLNCNGSCLLPVSAQVSMKSTIP